MKISVDKTTLLKSLDRCKSVTDAKSTMPVLGQVRLEVTDNKLLIGATDLFQAVETEVTCDVSETGSICVNARDLYDRVKQMPDGDVKLTLDSLALIVKAAKSARKFKLHGIPVSEFPSIPKMVGNTEPVRVQDRGLAEKFEAVIFSVSTDETRPFMNSVLVEEERGSIRLAGTDGHRLAVLSSSGLGESLSSRWLIPLRGAKELLKLLKESVAAKHEDHEVILYPDVGNLFVSVNGFQYCCKLTDANYPPYRQIIPAAWEFVVKIKKLQLVDALKAVRSSTGIGGGVTFKFNATEKQVAIDAVSESGEGHDLLTCEYDKCPSSDYSVNADYLIESIEPINTEHVVLKLSDAGAPILIEEDNDLQEYVSIVMPIRI